MDTLHQPIIVKQSFDVSIELIWNAITQVEQMRQWFFNNIPSFEPRVGFVTKFSVQSQERNFEHIWKIVEIKPKSKITYHWSYEEYTGEALVSFEVYKLGNQTEVKLTNIGLETFPQDIPEFTRESCAAGWQYFIQKSLKDYIDKK